jgi:Domain of unknown function (DUF4263)
MGGEAMTTYDGRSESVEVRLESGETVFLWHGTGSLAEDTEMARFDPIANHLRIFPRIRSGASLEEQFSQVTELQICKEVLSRWDLEYPVVESDRDGSLELVGLPDGFGKVFQYGLGLRRSYRGVVHAMEEHTECTVIRFGDSSDEGPDGDVFHMTLARFGAYKRSVDRNQGRGATVVRRINATEAHNAIADVLNLEAEKPTVGRHPIVQAMTREITGETVLDAAERRMLVQQASAESRTAAIEAPVEFGKLRKDIELVSLEVLIEQFEGGMTGSHAKDEDYWQDFFETNTFALQQLFAAPVALYGAQLVVKGVNALGKGSRIADFILVNTVTRSALVVEIKTPAAGLIGMRYRGAGGAEVFLPHKDLLGAVAQIQAQMESARIHLPTLLAQTPGAKSLETCVVRGAVIVGTAGSLGNEEKTSYLRYRAGLGDVEVLAFDEVCDRLKVLHVLLAAEADRDSSSP